MNRHERRAAAAKHRDVRALLAIHCAGPFSKPTPQECDRSVSVEMPFTHEQLLRSLWARHGWFVTVVSPPGKEPMEFAVLCPYCAKALVPELVREAEKHLPGRA